MRDEATQRAIDAAGGVNALARALNISGASVAGWSRIPAERCRRVAQITRLSLHELRPDIYPEPPADAA